MNTRNDLEQTPSWWKRNWKWALPSGGCLTIVIIGVIVIASAAYKLGNKLSNETSVFAFIEVIRTVQGNADVGAALGKPIEITANDYDPEVKNGVMDLEIDLEGSKANGILRVNATKSDGTWSYSRFEVTVEETEHVIDLLPKITN